MFAVCVFLLKKLSLLQCNKIAAVLHLFVLVVGIVILLNSGLKMLSLVFILSLLVELKIHFQGQIFALLNVLTHLICCHHFAHFTQSRSLFAQLFQMSDACDLLLFHRLLVLRLELPFLHLKIHTVVTLMGKLLVGYLLRGLLLWNLLLRGLKGDLVQLIGH